MRSKMFVSHWEVELVIVVMVALPKLEAYDALALLDAALDLTEEVPLYSMLSKCFLNAYRSIAFIPAGSILFQRD